MEWKEKNWEKRAAMDLEKQYNNLNKNLSKKKWIIIIRLTAFK